MNIYTSDLVAAVRKASGNIGIILQMSYGFLELGEKNN